MAANVALDVLEHADDLVRSRWRWGNRCAVEADDAFKFCAIGALWRARHDLKLKCDGYDEAQEYLAEAWAEVLNVPFTPSTCIPVMNDNGTYKQMKRAFARAKELAIADVR